MNWLSLEETRANENYLFPYINPNRKFDLIFLLCLAIRTSRDNNFNRYDVLPLTSDLLKLNTFCQNKLSALVEHLQCKPTLST